MLLIKDDEIREDRMREGSITHDDLTQALRMQTRQTDPAKLKLAHLERNGQISVISKEQDRKY